MVSPFPFSAIVGQDEMKLALQVAAVEPGIGGVLVFGDRGTGKSTAVRALAALLPDMKAVIGCPYHCDPRQDGSACVSSCPVIVRGEERRDSTVPVPVVDLPLGATEDRVVGALDLERALTRGEKAFEPGLLARAHRGFLYIDEVNLLEDHLVDLLLDVGRFGRQRRGARRTEHSASGSIRFGGQWQSGRGRASSPAPRPVRSFGRGDDADRPSDPRRSGSQARPVRAGFGPVRGRVGRTPTDSFVIGSSERRSGWPMLSFPTPPSNELSNSVWRSARMACAESLRSSEPLAPWRASMVERRWGTTSFEPLPRWPCVTVCGANPLDDAGSTTRVERAIAEVFDS